MAHTGIWNYNKFPLLGLIFYQHSHSSISENVQMLHKFNQCVILTTTCMFSHKVRLLHNKIECQINDWTWSDKISANINVRIHVILNLANQ